MHDIVLACIIVVANATVSNIIIAHVLMHAVYSATCEECQILFFSHFGSYVSP